MLRVNLQGLTNEKYLCVHVLNRMSYFCAMEEQLTICLASNNEHKRLEIKQLLPGRIQLLSLNEVGWNLELREDHDTFEGNATQKATTVAQTLGINCLSDDSGLCVDALDGAPGVFSARYAGSTANDQENLNKLLTNLKGVKNRKARFVTVMCLVLKGDTFLFKGEVEGTIADEPRGKSGFGYDPVFIPDGFYSTFAEISAEAKNKLSHRSKALSKVVDFLAKRSEE